MVVDYRQVKSRYEAEGLRVAQTLSLYFRALTDRMLILHRAAGARAVEGNADFLQSKDFHEFLAALEFDTQSTLGFALINLDRGRMIASSRAFPANLDVSDRSYTSAMRRGDQLFFDRVKVQPGLVDAFVIATQMQHDFPGAFVSSLKVDVLTEMLRNVARRPREAASLMTSGGTILLRNVPGDSFQLPPDAPAVQAVGRNSAGTYRATALSDGVDRIYFFQQVDGRNLYANFGIPVRAIWTEWGERLLPVTVLICLMGLLSFLLVRQNERSLVLAEQKRNAEAQRREAEELAELRQNLMAEANHRIKNNLTMVSSLVEVSGTGGRADVELLRARIRSIAHLHDLLHVRGLGDRVPVGDLLGRIVASPALIPPESHIKVDTALDDELTLEARRASWLAMVVTELMINAVKHAFVGVSTPRIEVQCRTLEDRVALMICDNGTGSAPWAGKASGMRLVQGLVRSLEGELSKEDGPGTCWRLIFPLDRGAGDDKVLD